MCSTHWTHPAPKSVLGIRLKSIANQKPKPGQIHKFISRQLKVYKLEPLPGVLGNTGTVAFIFREQGIFSNYFQGTGELLTRLLGSFLGTRGFSNGEQGIKSKKVKGSWEHAPPPLGGAQTLTPLKLKGPLSQ